MNQTVTYLQELTAIPSPTGYTREIADYLVKTIEDFLPCLQGCGYCRADPGQYGSPSG